jgi:hypothetical protein
MESLDIEVDRETFAVRSSLLKMEFEVMLEKTKKMEALLQTIITDSQVSTTDFYKPDETIVNEEPPRKKIKK